MFLFKSYWAVFALSYLSSIKMINGSTGCGRSLHSKSTGELVGEHLKAGETCDWHIIPENFTMIETLLVFEEFELEQNDKCIVSENNGLELFSFSKRKAIFTILPGILNLDVTVKIENNPPSDRKFRLYFSSKECYYYIDKPSGYMASPLYKDMKRSNDVICKWKFRDFKKIDFKYQIIFKEFRLTNSTLYIKEGKYQDKVYTGTDIPPNIFISEGTIFELHLNTKVLEERYSFAFSYGGDDPQKLTTEHDDDNVTTVTPTPFIINDIASICGREEYIEENGSIILGNTEHTNITFICTWNVNCEQISIAKEVYIVMEQFVLGNDDDLQILNSDGQILFGPYNGEKPSFSILTGVLKLQIRVQINKDQKMKRKLKIAYKSNCRNKLINEIGIVKLPLYKPSREFKMATCTWTYDLPDKTSIEKISFVQNKFNGHLSFQGNINPKNILGNDVRYVLAGENASIELNFDTHTETEFTFVYERVAAECSSFIQLSEQTKIISSTTQENNFNFWTSCFWIIQSPENTVLIIEIQKLNLVNVDDFITIIDGNNAKSSVLAQFNTGNQHKVNEKVIISRNNSILIFFNMPYESKSKFEAKVVIGSCYTFCDNGFCKLDEWNCNGIEECNDGSDEKNCNGTYICPSPKPSKSESTQKNSGTSSLAIGLAVPGAFIAGILVTIAFAAGRQIYRKRYQFDYGQYPIYNDS